MSKTSRLILLFAFSIYLCLTEPLLAQQQPPSASPDSDAGTEDLQKATQNPVASLITVPIQNNSNFGIDPYDRTQDVLNIQPVIPARITENWMLITRVIQPIVWQPYSATTGGEYGLGDMNPTFFLSPAKPGKVIWGVGPAFLIPTATNSILGQGKFGIGPSAVALIQPGHWTLGLLVNNIWSVAGSSNRADVNQMTLQYFINYNLPSGWYLSSAPIISSNWEVSQPNRWTVPAGGGAGRVMRIGFQPVNISAQFYGNPVRPPGTSPWGMRLAIAFLFPKSPKR